MASQLLIEECVLDGLENSHNEYFEWSDGEYIWNAPEYLLTVNIAKELKKHKEIKYLTLEDSVKETMKIANAAGAGKMHQDLRKDGRFDIVLWGGDEEPTPPIAVIEVKNKVYCFDRIKQDIERIKQVLLRKEENSTIEFGLMAFYATNTYKGSDNNFNELFDGLVCRLRKDTIYCLNRESGGVEFEVKKFERSIQDYSKVVDGNVYRPVIFKIRIKVN